MEKINSKATNDTSAMQPEIKEFVRKKSNEKTVLVQDKGRNGKCPAWLWLIGFCLVLAAVIVCGILLLKEPITTVILVALLETALSVCLCRTQIWLHGLVIILNIALGFLFQLPIFMVLGCVIYLAGATLMHLVNKK